MTLEQILTAKEAAHLPSGVSCRVHYQGSAVDIPEPRDPFEVCNAARAKIFGGALLKTDSKFDAVIARRQTTAAEAA